MVGGIKIRNLVGDFGVRLERCETMQKARWDEKLRAVRRRQMRARMPAIGRRSLPHVDSDVDDGASENAHQLRLRARRGLIVKAAHRARPARERMIVLHEYFGDACLSKALGVERLAEKPARILKSLRRDEENALKIGFLNVE